MARESADELMIRRFAGARRDGIGRFVADPVSGRWSWSDAVYEIFGYPARSVAPSWRLIINHIPEEDRAVAQTAYELATTHLGPFSWSHRIHAGDAMRSMLVLGETSPLDSVEQPSEQPRHRPAVGAADVLGLVSSGPVRPRMRCLQLVMCQLSKAAPRALGLASSLSWWNIKARPDRAGPSTSPHLVRIRSREGPVELVRNGVEVIGEQSGIDIEGHRRGGVPEHLLHCLYVGASGDGKTGRGVPQLVRRKSR